MKDIELLPCPFCGAACHFEKDEDAWEWVECESCGMQGNRSASLMDDCKPILAEAWNRRAAVEADRAQRVPDVDALSNFIREIDGAHRFGAGALAERICEWLASTPAPAQQEPDCPMCKGSGEDPEGYFDQSRGPDGGTHDGPCRDCAGTGAAQHQEPPQQERKPMTDREADILTEQHYYLGGRMPADYRISVVRATERHHGIKE